MTFSAWVDKWIYQLAHVGWGALITVFIGSLYGVDYGMLATAGFAAIKEFAFDPLTETPTLSGGFKGDAIDFAFFCVGGIIGGIMAGLIRYHSKL